MLHKTLCSLLALATVGCVSTHKSARRKRGGARPDRAFDVETAAPTAAETARAAQTTAPRPPAADLDPTLAALPFPSLPKDEQNRDLIRVRVFPHPKRDPWGGKESGARVALKGNCRSYKGHPDRPDGTNTALETKARFDLTADALVTPLWFSCTPPVTVEREGDVKNWSYEGNFYAHVVANAAGGKGVELINVVPVETYLRGVLPSEVIPSWPAETLKAQAVASRSYAYYNIAHNKIDPASKLYDVDDTPFFQVYTGVQSAVPSTDQAIEATAGLALSYMGRIVLSFFCTDAGGHTESAQEVFNLNAPYCKARKETHDLAGTKTAWTKTVTLATLAQKLGKPITGITVTSAQTTASGRVRAVTAALAGGGSEEIPAADFKKAAGAKSALFRVTFDAAKKELRLDGTGSGHGVGLSQKGAKELARQKGWDFKKILDFYYEGATLCTLSDIKAKEWPRCGANAQAAR